MSARSGPVVNDPYRREGERPPLLSGMFVSVTFASEPPAGSVTIPRRGLRPGDQVWLLDDDNTLRIRPVDVVQVGVEEAVVTAGLVPGDRLITSNLQLVVEGMPLRAGSAGAAMAAGGERP